MIRNLKLLYMYTLNAIRTGMYYLSPKYWVCERCDTIAFLSDVEKNEANSEGSKLTCVNPNCYTREYMVFRGIKVKKLSVGERYGETWVGPFYLR